MAFDYLRKITVTPNSIADLTDYQVKLVLTNTNFNFGHLQKNGEDVRFYTSFTEDGSSFSGSGTQLNYWIESWSQSSGLATIWVLLSSDIEVFYLLYGDSSLSSDSNGSSVFPELFDHFESSNKGVFPVGSDSGWSSAFDPVSRRMHWFGGENNSSSAWDFHAYLEIDNGKVGFLADMPSIYTLRTWAYHPPSLAFYGYGGRNGSGVKTDEIVRYIPATDTWETLSETLPAAAFVSGQASIYCPNDRNVYLFGLDGGNILVHNPFAGTVADTGANIDSAVSVDFGDGGDIACVWVSETERIYLIGGGGSGPGTDAHDNVDVYDPANPSTDPVASGITLSQEKSTVVVAEYIDGNENSFIYCFGGYQSDISTYSDRIEKITINGGSESIETLVATLYQADDDALAFYDSINDRVYSGPWIHSTGSANEQDRKSIMIALNPNDDSLEPEPNIGTVPSGWNNVGTSTVLSPTSLGSMLRIYERTSTEFLRAEKNNLTPEDVYMIEIRLNPAKIIPVNPATGDTYQVSFLNNAGSPVFRFNNNSAEVSWFIDVGPNPGTTVASFDTGVWQILGALIDTDNEKVYGLKDRDNKTAELDWANAGITPNKIFINNSTAGGGGFVVDWILIRKSTTATEPTTIIGGESTSFLDGISSALSGPMLAGIKVIRKRIRFESFVTMVIPFTSIWSNKIYQAYAGCLFIGRTDNVDDREIRVTLPVQGDLFAVPQVRPYHLTILAVDFEERDVDYGSMLPPRPHPTAKLSYTGYDLDGDAKEDLIYQGNAPNCPPEIAEIIGRVDRTGA